MRGILFPENLVSRTTSNQGQRMLPRRTCLLLGAGASSHLGFPLGGDLRKKMLLDLLAMKDKKVDELPEDFRRGEEDLALFYDRLAYGNWASPDAFLERHREVIKTGKYLMCRCLSELEKPVQVVQNGGWYDRLVSAIHVDDHRKLKDNRLSIVTFNYDRSIDFRLHKYVENQFGLSSDDAWKVLSESIPIIHVHGTLGEYPQWSYGDKSAVWERGQDIKIVSEVAEETPEFHQASALLKGAERVVVFGFGFGIDNVRRLKFFTEQETDDRDIIVASGPAEGGAHRKSTNDWLSRWGLKGGRHVFNWPTNTLFIAELDPFA